MSVLNLSGDEAPECPLCMELLELDDISFYPCICGYQVNTYIFNSMLDSANGSLTYWIRTDRVNDVFVLFISTLLHLTPNS
jgi:hypothetical protein